MISQLLAVIMMACGVASGTKAPSNTFYDERKPQIKKAVTQETYIDLTNYTTASYIGNNYSEGSWKYYLGDSNDSYYHGSSYINQYINIYNSIYTYTSANYNNNSDYDEAYITIILNINNYYESTLNNLTFSFQYYALTDSEATLYQGTTRRIYDGQVINQYIDNTITNSRTSLDIAQAIKNNTNYIDNAETSNTLRTQYTSPNLYLCPVTINYSIGNLEAHSNKTIVLVDQVLTSKRNSSFGVVVNKLYGVNDSVTSPLNITMTGYINEPGDITVEVVDIPGVMFTVLTMPFSFISTAFNLTIFPGTPYQVNFANLFMVLLATFILAWIIKKVFH